METGRLAVVLALLTLALSIGVLSGQQAYANLNQGTIPDTSFSAGPLPLVPNLQVLKPHEIRLSSSCKVGTKCLRFSTTSWNSGDGALEFIATGDGSNKHMNQRIYNDDGITYEDHNATADSFKWHPGHNHFHVQDYASYSLKEADANDQRQGSKTTFCIIDTDRINHKLTGASKKRQYNECNDELQGMSVGWGDTYRYYLEGQEIDVTELPIGDYILIIEVNPKGHIIEKNVEDNLNEVLLHINVETGTVNEVDDENGSGRQNNGRCPHC